MKKIVLASVVFVVVLIGSIQIAADTFLPPEPFEIWSADGTKVFRFNPLYEDGTMRRFAETAVYKDNEILYSRAFPTMGVSESNFFFSQDFQHLMFMPTTGFEVALQFFTNGVLTKTHYISDLVRDTSQVRHSVTMALWRGIFPDMHSAVEHIAEQDILRVITVDGIIYTFDLTTGVVLGCEYSNSGRVCRNNAGQQRIWLFVAAGTTLVGIGVLAFVAKKKRSKK